MGQDDSPAPPTQDGVRDPEGALLELGQCTLRADDEERLWREALAILGETLGVDAAAALRWLDDETRLEVAAEVGLDEFDELEPGETVVRVEGGTTLAHCLKEDEPIAVVDLDAADAVARSPIGEYGEWCCVLSVGICCEERAWGVCEFYWDQPRRHSSRLVEFVGGVADLLGEAVHRIGRERGRAEARHRELYLLVEHAHDLIGTSDLEGEVTYLNPAGCRLVGLQQRDVAGRTVYEFLTRADAQLLDEKIMPRVIEHGSWHGLLRLRDFETGELHHTEATILLLEDPDTAGPIGLATIQHDVSSRMRLEEQLRQSQKLEALGLLASGVAHDFNNHLTVIKGYSDLLLEDIGEGAGGARIQKIRDVTEKAQGLAEQLLIFSRRKMRQTEVLELGEVLDNLRDMLRSLIGETIDIELEASSEDNFIELDPSDIEQIILNLAVNARDAIEGSGTISLEVRRARPEEIDRLEDSHEIDDQAVVLEVTDTGRGMPEEVLDHAFEPFFTTKPPRRGTGLGLATVDRIVTEAGGTVAVDSEPGCGTQFMVYFPRVEPVEDESDEQPVDMSQLGGDEVVLVVEDDRDVLEYITELLERHGYHPIPCTDGEKAIDALKMYDESIDAVVSDVMLPNLPPEQFREALIERFPQFPFVLTSGYSDLEHLREDDLMTEIPFLPKPIDAGELLNQLRSVLDVDGGRRSRPS